MSKHTTGGTPQRKPRLGCIIAAITLLTTLCTFSSAWAATFKTINGQVVIEAENRTSTVGGIGGTWYKKSGIAGYKGTGFMQSATADPKTLSWKSGITHLAYEINFQQTGTYYVHFRTYATGDTDNGYFARLIRLSDNKNIKINLTKSSCDYIYVGKNRQWNWETRGGGGGTDAKVPYFNIPTAGKYKFKIYRRDKGSRIDRIWLVKASANAQARNIFKSTKALGFLPDPSKFIASGKATTTNDPPTTTPTTTNTTGKETQCMDDKDNDHDGFTDCQDDDCQGQLGSQSLSYDRSFKRTCQPIEQGKYCNDGYDNDQDGKIDYEDSSCSGGSSSSSGTSGSTSTTGKETACKDNKDNNNNTLIDCQDPDCKGQDGSISLSRDGSFRLKCNPNESGELCNDNYDNDQDGKIDCSDSGCYSSSACSSTKASSGDSGNSSDSGDTNNSGDSNNDDLAFDFLANPLSGTNCPEEYDTTCPEESVAGQTDNGVLVMTLGGDDPVEGISGGATTTFTTTQAGTVSVTFDYQLMTANYDADECGEAFVAIDGQMLTPAGTSTPYLKQFCGRDNTGGWDTNGWVYQQTVSIHLEAGVHDLVLGGYNNAKTGKLETTTVKFQNISISKP